MSVCVCVWLVCLRYTLRDILLNIRKGIYYDERMLQTLFMCFLSCKNAKIANSVSTQASNSNKLFCSPHRSRISVSRCYRILNGMRASCVVQSYIIPATWHGIPTKVPVHYPSRNQQLTNQPLYNHSTVNLVQPTQRSNNHMQS
ncbi:unnamed protein product [Orchesella dallaii]|uniref:Secreted protein n=1 Tax=Orchesella dallaii TaxID=48710 RepID=A0ABP1S075_9HEXA